MKFFEIVPSGTNIPFIQLRWRFIVLSIFLVVLSLGAMIWRHVETGSFLNFGIDFAGGSQVRLALDPEKDPGLEPIREAIAANYDGSSVVAVPDAEHEVLIRVKETISIDAASAAACHEAVKKVGDAELISFNHPEGGSKIFLKYASRPNYKEVEQALNEAGCHGTADKGFGGDEDEYPVDFSLIGIGAEMSSQLDAQFGEGTVREIIRSETVGAKAGDQLKTDGAKALLYATGFIFLYVMLRFDLRFAPGGIVALIHDAFLVVGAFAITGKEFSLTTVAAVLTVVGYSINDTIVIFDRIRERIALYRDVPVEETANAAINETLSRTILTTLTTLFVVLTTYVFGSGAIKDFAFALIVGMLVGTYSSIFMATPVFLWVNKRFYAGQGHLDWLEKQEREGTGKLLGEEPPSEGAVVKPPAEAPDPAALVPRGESEAEGEEVRKTTRRRRRRRPDASPE